MPAAVQGARPSAGALGCRGGCRAHHEGAPCATGLLVEEVRSAGCSRWLADVEQAASTCCLGHRNRARDGAQRSQRARMRASVAALTSSGLTHVHNEIASTRKRTPCAGNEGSGSVRVPSGDPTVKTLTSTTFVKPPPCFHAAIQSQIGGQAVQTGSSGCVNSSNQSGSGGYVDCSGYASQASRR